MNKRGQALVEFVIILPIFVFMLLAVIDVGKIIYFSNVLENKVSDAITMYNNDMDEYDIKNKINKEMPINTFKVKKDKKYIEFSITKKVEVITPGLNLIFKNPYEVKAKRVIYNE